MNSATPSVLAKIHTSGDSFERIQALKDTYKGERSMYASDLRDEDWERIRHYFEYENGYGNIK